MSEYYLNIEISESQKERELIAKNSLIESLSLSLSFVSLPREAPDKFLCVYKS